MKRSLITRIGTGTLAFLMVASLSYAPLSVSRAHAQLATFESNPAVVGGVFATSLSTGSSELIERALNAIAWTVAKTAIQSMTKSIVTWINGGFDGSPAFVTDLNRNLRQLGDGVAQGFLTQLANDQAVHSPFIDQVVTNVGAGYYLYSSRDSLAQQLRYTLNQSTEDDAAFLAGDFDKGGWNGWFSSFMNPANNPYGAQMIASQALASQLSASANQRVTELGWGSGFLSWRGDCRTPITVTGAQNLDDSEKCLDYEIQTPGSVIENTLIPQLNSPLHQLELADSINEIVGALAQQLVSQVVGGTGLRGTSQPSQGGGSSALSQATSASQYDAVSATLSAGFIQSVTSTRTQVATYKANWQKIRDAASRARSVCSTSDTRSEIDDIIARADAAIAKATSADASLASIIATANSATNAAGGNRASLLAQVSSDYQTLLAGSTLPSSAETAEASVESRDSGTNVPTSLYTRMTVLAQNNCRVDSAD